MSAYEKYKEELTKMLPNASIAEIDDFLEMLAYKEDITSNEYCELVFLAQEPFRPPV